MGMVRNLLLPLSAALMLATAAAAALPPKVEYVGSPVCARCHETMHEGWKRTYHSTVVQDARLDPQAVLGDFSKEEPGLDRADIEYTVGGHWAQRYLKRVDGELFALPNRWSVASHKWEPVDVWSWKKKPYSRYCVGCHATRYDPEDQTLVEHTVGCEACHGPGRRHAESLGLGAIVNPAHLSADERDLLCAACHVRGTDLSGAYQFPVGYAPGGKLEEHYVAVRTADGEDRRDALLREVRDWKARTERGDPPNCEVCGIERPAKNLAGKRDEPECRACHKFDDTYTSHTGHPKALSLGCTDCHRPVDGPMAANDVHDQGYFLVHRTVHYEAVRADACRECHADPGEEELLDRVRRWGQHRKALPN